ncbi:MAG: hypothetical protein FWD49_00560 [Firmicutes bacterium]|nr:hypothetical protein [Bacillota bacterium]
MLKGINKKIKYALIFVLLLASFVVPLTVPAISHSLGETALEATPAYGASVEGAKGLSGLFGSNSEEVTQTEINNFVIYIYFSNESPSVFDNFISNQDEFFNGENSPYDYFSEVTYDALSVYSVLPKMDNGATYLHQASNTRTHYDVRDNNSINRRTREAELLFSATYSAMNYFDTEGLTLGTTTNGQYIDSVTYVISGLPASGDNAWGGLLWPHAWDLNSLKGNYSGSVPINNIRIGGLPVKDFALVFADEANTRSTLIHEICHVLGAPDLYTYSDAYDYVSVGNWDIMHWNKTPPQYPLTYMRETYLGGLGANQVQTVTNSGHFSLKPVTTAQKQDILAYKIPTADPNEFFYVEHRNKEASQYYDTVLDGSGLIIYRVRLGVKDGNAQSRLRSTQYPYEVFIFRPSVSNLPDNFRRSQEDIKHAHLSPNNSRFSAVGKSLTERPATAGTYDYGTLFLTNGANSGIKINAYAISNDRLDFTISLNGSDIPIDLPPEEIILNHQTINIALGVNENDFVLSGEVLPSVTQHKNIIFVSSNESVVTISPSGEITGISEGSAVITAYVEGYEEVFATVEVTVSNLKELEAIEFFWDSLTVYKDSDISLMLKYLPEPADISGWIVTFSTANHAICEVDSLSGKLLPRSVGTVIITATAVKDGSTLTTQIEITVIDSSPIFDYTVSWEFYSEPIKTYLFGEGFKIGGSLLLTKLSGGSVVHEIRPQDLYIFNTNALGTSTVTLRVVPAGEESRPPIEIPYTITVVDGVGGIRANLNKTVYDFGEDINLLAEQSGLILVMLSGKEETSSLILADIIGYQKFVLGFQTIIIKYTNPVTGEFFAEQTVNVTINTAELVITPTGADEGGVFRYIAGSPLGIIGFGIDVVYKGISHTAFNGDTTKNIWFILPPSYYMTAGTNTFAVEVRIKSTVALGFMNIGPINVTAEGMGVTAVEVKGGGEYLFGENINDIHLLITLDSGEKISFYPETPEYDKNLTDIFQPYKFRYGGVEYSFNIIIYDNPISFLPISSQTIKFGETPSITVSVLLASGKNKVLTTEEFVLSYDKSLGTKQAQVTLSGTKFTIPPLNFTLTITDAVKTITQITGINTQVRFGDIFSYHSVFKLTMLSGAEEETEFSLNTFEIINALDSFVLGMQTVKIKFKETNAEFSYEVFVKDFVASLSVSTASKSLYIIGEGLVIFVTKFWATGYEEAMFLSEYDHDYDITDRRIGNRTVKIWLREDSSVFVNFQIEVVDKVTAVNIVNEGLKKEFEFGEAFSFLGTVVATFGAGGSKTFTHENINEFNISYKHTQAGLQNITFELGGVHSRTMTVSVKPPNNSNILSLSEDADAGVKINHGTGGAPLILLPKLAGSLELLSFFVTHTGIYRVSFADSSGNLLSSTQEIKVLPVGAHLVIENLMGEIVRKYRLHIHGDANNDGVFDENDLVQLMRRYLIGDGILEVNDFSGNGTFELTDLIKWARRASDEKTANLPQNGNRQEVTLITTNVRKNDKGGENESET